jgi:DNA mismatch repair ATPase MutL
MFVLNINVESKNVDVNVTPDKLQMFIKSENALLAIIKSSLMNLFSQQYKSLNVEDISFNSNKNSSVLMESFFSYNKTKSNNVQQKLADLEADEDEQDEEIVEQVITDKTNKRSRDEQDIMLNRASIEKTKPLKSPFKSNKVPDFLQSYLKMNSPTAKKPRQNEENDCIEVPKFQLYTKPDSSNSFLLFKFLWTV